MIIIQLKTDDKRFMQTTFTEGPTAYAPKYAWDNENLQMHLYSDPECTRVIPGTFLKSHFYEIRRFHDKAK